MIYQWNFIVDFLLYFGLIDNNISISDGYQPVIIWCFIVIIKIFFSDSTDDYHSLGVQFLDQISKM